MRQARCFLPLPDAHRPSAHILHRGETEVGLDELLRSRHHPDVVPQQDGAERRAHGAQVHQGPPGDGGPIVAAGDNIADVVVNAVSPVSSLIPAAGPPVPAERGS